MPEQDPSGRRGYNLSDPTQPFCPNGFVAQVNLRVPGQTVQQTARPGMGRIAALEGRGGRFYKGTEAWDESEHQRDAGGRFT